MTAILLSRPPLEAVHERCPGLDTDAAWDTEALLRGDIYPTPRLTEHAKDLARAHGLPSMQGSAAALRARIGEARQRIRRAYATLNSGTRAGKQSASEEWLGDNAHIVNEQLREIDEDLPWGYLIKLPRLARGAMRGYPRVYGLCLDYLRHTDARIDPEVLAEYLAAYQSVSPLAIGELWAVPTMLRLGLILTTGSLASAEADAVLRRREQRDDEALDALAGAPESMRHGAWKTGSTDPPPSSSFPTLPAELALRRKHARQAADQVLIGNAITSMRCIAALDWRTFFERASLVEAILRGDPDGVYAATDEASRDRCRHAVELLAERSALDERAVATRAVELARAAAAGGTDRPWEAHVGHYLIGEGRKLLDAEVGYRPTLGQRAIRAVCDHPGAFYGGTAALLLALLWSATAAAIGRAAVSPAATVALLVLAGAALLEIALALVNSLVVALLPPRLLAKLSLRGGIPPEHRTLVVVPALVEDEASLERLLSRLEICALANADANLHFALITDFADADVPELPEDAELLATAVSGIAALNLRHGGPRGERFFLFHRPRTFDAAQGVFMGWERKRGKLEELNRLLTGRGEAGFSVVTAPTDLLRSVRYVVTLDADTELPRDAARALVGAIAHPLNRPRWDGEGRRVGGYGIVQPRVGTLPDSSRRSRFARIMAGPPGIDPYTTASSDVYQDLFASASYIGKAIYDVEAFARALEGRVPDNRLLSHDLFEGILAGTALASDIELLDEQPSSYPAAAKRQHRWLRGDLQLLPWLLPRVPAPGGRSVPNDLPMLGRWKVLDNLRRALVAPGLVTLAIVGWLAGRSTAALVTALLALALTTPALSRAATTLLRRPRPGTPRFHALATDLWTNTQQLLVHTTFLLDEAAATVDAMGRTAYRMLISKRHLLEWQTAGMAERSFAGRLPRRLWLTAGLSLGALALLRWTTPGSLPFAAPLLLGWASSPLWAWLLARPEAPRHVAPLTADDVLLLRATARKTWRFFETFVTAEDHFLPPDNYQEEPVGAIAHRTSPTNIGGYLLSVVSARDFGFLTMAQVAERLEATLSTVDRLEHREGHILNWYDTTTLAPLDPHYVSTVDSGNLAAYLWTVRQACAELLVTPIAGESVFLAARDAARLARTYDAPKGAPDEPDGLEIALSQSATRARSPYGFDTLAELDAAAAAARRAHEQRTASDPDGDYWLSMAGLGPTLAAAELRELAPWVERLSRSPDALATGALGEAFRRLRALLDGARSPAEILASVTPALAQIDELDGLAGDGAVRENEGESVARHLGLLREDLGRSLTACQALTTRLERLGDRASALADGMSFSFLYDEERLLLSIGYNAHTMRLDGGHYDLLASEARLASFLGIAKGDLRQETWFRLGRTLARLPKGRVLWSWSGSMFEYLMPLLVMKDRDQTLLHETYVAVVDTQMRYARKRGAPWGISESLFNVMDLSMTYQYRAFGVPGLGLKRGLEDDLVIAPYATALAALVRPALATANLRAIAQDGGDGRYGFYEAIDYTPTRKPTGRRGVVVKAFMAHHQGMTLVALGNVLFDGAMQRRFHADPRVRATELLLEERPPLAAPIAELRPPPHVPVGDETDDEVVERVPLDPHSPPRAHLLGHGDASTIVTSVGTGVTVWRGIDVNRFREDGTTCSGGMLVYLRDPRTGRTWSVGYEPTRVDPDAYETTFSADRVEIRRRDGDIEAVMEVVVSPESPAEVRRVSLTNHGFTRREIEVTTHTDIVLAPRGADRAHRAFSGLFVETEAIPHRGALLAFRRIRGDEPESWAVQVLVPEEGEWSALDYDSSRAAFVGRGRDVQRPAALEAGARLSRTVGAVLDPAFTLRRTVVLKPGQTARVALTTALGADRAAAERLIEQFSDPHAISRTFELGRADARLELRHLGVSGEDGALFQRLLSALVFPLPGLRVGGTLEIAGARGRGALWAQGISGDLPILVLRIDDAEFTDLGGMLLFAHELFRLNGFPLDLVLLNEEPGGYSHAIGDRLNDLVRASVARGSLDRPGGVMVRRADQMSDADRAVLVRAAHVVLVASKGSLARQLRRAIERPPLPDRSRPSRRRRSTDLEAPFPRRELLLDFDNGIGGFDPRTGEYVIRVSDGKRPPAPWCNVVANPSFGFVVSEGGASCTWSGNSQSHRLTPWSNDPVSDPSGEYVFVRDAEDGAVWSATPAPAGGGAEYTVRHGWGYSVFEHARRGIDHALTVFVDPERSAKISILKLTNRGETTRRLRVYGIVDWVLGSVRERSSLSVATAWDRAASAIFATNALGGHPERCAFFSTPSRVASHTADRSELFGHGRSRSRPAGLDRVALSDRTGAGLDPCAALEVWVTLLPGQTIETAFVLGEGASRRDAHTLAAELGEPGAVQHALAEARRFWQDTLSTVTVRTPDPALDRLLNGWLLYQTMSCRLFGRTAFYQSSGAFGFRDQLQDVMALFQAEPRLARKHILRAASRQFLEGDVQHWWHPDTGEGVRTRCSDDMLWLPYVVIEYVRATGDRRVLDEVVPFLEEKPIPAGESELFGRPVVSVHTASLYEHCVRAIDAGTTQGPHGLPRMRGGDWNDGMNRIGGPGAVGGESVWLAWFLAKTLHGFAAIAESRGDEARHGACLAEAARLAAAAEAAGWDGAWYRRGYFDDGTVVGSSEASECCIDAIAQSWAVISGMADPDRATLALDQSEALLVREPEQIMSLLWPPFTADATRPNAGYIASYPPGVRENGGQYTHGVLWTVLAHTCLRQGDRAGALLSLLNPIHHGDSAKAVTRYAVEPYVVAADVSAAPGHVGRGGWTWYTGAAAWMYRIGLESMLGVHLDDGQLVVTPRAPTSFGHYEVDVRHGGSLYRIAVDNPERLASGAAAVTLDGAALAGAPQRIPLVDDGRVHDVHVVMVRAETTAGATASTS